MDLINIFLLILTFSGFVTAVALVTLVLYLHKKSIFYNQTELPLNEAVYNHAFDILNTAHTAAMNSMKDTEEKTTKLLASATYLSEEARKNLHDQLAEVAKEQAMKMNEFASDLMKRYENSMRTDLRNSATALENVTRSFEQSAIQNLVTLKENVEKTLDDENQILKDSYTNKLKEIDDELAEYKKGKIEEFTKQLYASAQAILSEILGRSITLEMHNEIVLKQIEKARSTAFFD